jgi:hypothetical protein
MRSIVVTALLVSCASVVAFWLARGGVNESRVEPKLVQPKLHDVAAKMISTEPHTESAESLPAAPAENAAEMRTPEATIWVVQDESGGALANATITRTVVDTNVTGLRSPTDEAWSDVARLEAATSSGVDGRFVVPALPPAAADAPSVLWVSLAGYRAQAIELETASASASARIVVLPKDLRLAAIVRDAAGRAVPGATVIQVFDESRANDVRLSESISARAHYRRTFITDEGGMVTLPTLSAHSCLVATHGASSSKPWRGKSPARATLELGATCTLAGRVLAPPGVEIAPGAVVRVVSETGALRDILGYVRVSADGAFGPAAFPCVAADNYELRVERSPFVPTAHLIAAPRPGERKSVDVNVELGGGVVVLVQDLEKKPIPAADLQFDWQVDGRWEQARAKADEGGIARLLNARPGVLYIQASHSGFRRTRLGAMEVKTAETLGPVVIALPAGGRIAGRCLQAGQPVEDFRVYYWGADITQLSYWEFKGREDGAFELEDAPLGEVGLFASSLQVPKGEAERVIVGETDVAHVDLELGATIGGRGRVIDASTQLPIEGATIQQWLSHEHMRLIAWGAPIETDAQGAFSGDAFLEGPNGIEVSADGYASSIQYTKSTGRVGVDFGLVALHKTTRLTVRVGLDADRDATACTVQLAGAMYIPPRACGTEGTVTFEDIPPGYYEVYTEPKDGWRLTVAIDVPPEGAVLDVPWRRCRSVTATVTPVPGEVLPTGMYVRAVCRVGRICLQASTYASKLHDLSKMPADSFRFDAFDERAKLLGSTLVSSSPGVPKEVELVLCTKSAFARVLDKDRHPISGVGLIIHLVGDPNAWGNIAITKEDGLADLGCPSGDKATIMIDHPTGRSVVSEVSVDAAKNEPVELIFDASGSVRLQVVDGETPVAAAALRFMDTFGAGFLILQIASDENGLVLGEQLGLHEFDVVTESSFLWPAWIRVTAEAAPTLTTFQVRRRGGMTFTVTSVAGAVPNTAIALHNVEFDTDVASWIANGSVAASSPTLSTDEQGQLTVQGLPRGEYRWSVPASDGSTKTGTVVVPALSTVSEIVFVD